MLTDLHIRNLGVIEEASAEFASGLTVVTGETGAGKTMVVSSLRLLSGQRADASRVRAGADRASVEGVFSSTSQAVADLVEEVGGYVDASGSPELEVIATRTVTAAGRSRAHLAGRTVAAGVLTEFARHAITIHGQNDQLRLLDPTRQLEALDSYAGTRELVASYRAKRATHSALAKDLARRVQSRRELALESETLTRALDHIDGIDPQPGEDARVKEDIRRLQDADDVRTALTTALRALDSTAVIDGSFDVAELAETDGAIELLGRAQAELNSQDATLARLAQRIDEATVQLSDIASEIAQAIVDIPDPEALESLLHRQQQLRELRKYAVDTDGAIDWRDRARKRLADIDVSGTAIEELRAKLAAAEDAMLADARKLSEARAKAARSFSAEVSAEIRGLHMAAAVEVELTTVDPGPDGIDAVEFQLVQGGHRTALSSSASGGELSRIMLALEVIMAGRGRTLVFDEVDAGVGGKAAVEIGRRLARLAVNNQVIVVTHLPQVAAFADVHLYVAKDATDTSVTSSVRALDRPQRLAELARMLAGLESDTGRAHAEELVEMAERAKADLRA